MLEQALADTRRLAAIHVQYWRRTYSMAQVTLTKRYSGSALGVVWSVVKPLTYLLAFWFAVSVGLRGMRSVDGFPYLMWLMPGLMAWYFVSDSITHGGEAIRRNSNFVTRLPYPVPTLPVSEVLSFFLVHLILMCIVTAVFLVAGYGLGLTVLQLPYFMLCCFALGAVVATLFSALTAISSDIQQAIKSGMTLLFWFTPILWSVTNLTGALRTVIMANPITYLLVGYRNTYVYHRWVTSMVGYSIYFWASLAVLTLLASYVYSRLEPGFADVL